MPPFDLDLKDPKPDVLERTMATAVVTANGKARIGLMNPNPAEYSKFATKEYHAAPQGVAIWLSDQGRVETFPPTPRATLLGVVWRTTPIGRQVRVVGRRIEPFAESPSHRFGPPWRKWPPLCLFEAWTQCWPSRRTDDEIYCTIAFAPGGTKVALGRSESEVELLDWASGEGVTLRPPLEGERAERPRTRALAFSPDGKLLAAGSGISGFVDDPREEWWGRGGGIYLYDAVKGQLLAKFDAKNDDVMALAFSPDGELLFSAATDCQLRVFDVKTRAEFAALGGHVGGINALAFSPDGQTLASAGGDGLVRLWPWRRLLERPVEKKKLARKKKS